MDKHLKAAFAVACTLGASSVIPTGFAAPVLSEDGLHTYDDEILIPTLIDPTDPENLAEMGIPANIRVPISNDPTEAFPLIVFISSGNASVAPPSRFCQI